MELARALLYLLAVVLIVLASLGVGGRVSLALLGLACALLAFALSDIAHGLGH